MRFRVFDNNLAVVNMRFTEKDKLGTYRVLATVHDNVGGRKIDLEESIEVTR